MERDALLSTSDLVASQHQHLAMHQTEHAQELQSVQQLLAGATAQLRENELALQGEHDAHVLQVTVTFSFTADHFQEDVSVYKHSFHRFHLLAWLS